MKLMLHANINITGNSNQYQYIVEYDNPEDLKYAKTNIKYFDFHEYNDDISTHFDDIVFMDDQESENYVKHFNHWYQVHDVKYSTSYTPKISEGGLLRLYFPEYSIDTYVSGCDYALTVNTWIKGRCVVLGSYIFNRLDAIACDKVRIFNNKKYYECIEFQIIDAMSLMYSDDWKEWRRNLCNESKSSNLVNSVGSALYISLHPVIKTENGYMKIKNYVGGQGAMNLTANNDDYLNLDIQPNTIRSLKKEAPAIECNLKFNKYYKGDIKDYLIETYGRHDYKFQYEMVIGNENDIYSIVTSKLIEPTSTYKFPKNKIKNFANGDGWVPGINIVCSVNIFNEEESMIYLLSNSLPLTEDLFRYFIQIDFKDNKAQTINYVNLDELDMKLVTLNIANKIENNIVQIDRPADAKSNIIQPVFFKAVEGSNIIVHPEVTEVLCINLDQYKSQVNSFTLQIEGVQFIEYGRNSSGVMFKVIGNKLPKEISNGTYYILNQDEELVTTGKYTYVS